MQQIKATKTCFQKRKRSKNNWIADKIIELMDERRELKVKMTVHT